MNNWRHSSTRSKNIWPSNWGKQDMTAGSYSHQNKFAVLCEASAIPALFLRRFEGSSAEKISASAPGSHLQGPIPFWALLSIRGFILLCTGTVPYRCGVVLYGVSSQREVGDGSILQWTGQSRVECPNGDQWVPPRRGHVTCNRSLEAVCKEAKCHFQEGSVDSVQ